jgi:O-antigen ligase
MYSTGRGHSTYQRTEALRHPNVILVWLGATIGAAVVGSWLVSSLSYRDGMYWFVGGLDLALSFIFYPFGILQFIFLSLIGELASEDAAQFTPIKIIGLVVALRRVIDLTFLGRPLNVVKASPAVWAFLFVLALGLSVFGSRNISKSVTALLTYGQLLVMFFLIIDFVRDKRELQYLLAVLILSGIVNAGFAIYQFHFEHIMRVEGAIGNANRFGIIQLALLCQLAPILGFLSMRRLLPVVWLPAVLIAYSILLSFSRGVFVATVAVFLYGLLFLRSSGVRSKVALVTVTIAGLLLVPEGFYDRIQTIPAALSGIRLSEGSISTRADYYRAGIQMGLDHPLTGVGLGQFDHHIAGYANLHMARAGGAHNMYISIFAEAGSAGIVAFLGFLVTSFLAARGCQWQTRLGTRFQMAFANGVELGNVALFVGGLFASLEYSKVLWLLLAFALAIRKLDVQQ